MCTFAGDHNRVQRENWEMKRTTLISASLLLAFAGCTCGQGWRPNIFTRLNNRIHGVSNVGEPCDAGCQGASNAAPVATGGCESCGAATGANYGGYEGQIIDSYEGVPVGAYNETNYGGSTYVGTSNVVPSNVVSSNVVSSNVGNMATEYRPTSTPYTPATRRMEPIAAKRAN
jgi:hypothetical protein